MNRILTLLLALTLAMSLMTACGGHGAKAPNTSNNSSAPANTQNTPSDGNEKQDKKSDKPDKKTAPEITVNPGDVVFDNEYIKLEYRQVFVYNDSIDVQCLARRKTDETFLIFSGEDGVGINGVMYPDFMNIGFTQTLTGSAEVPTLIFFDKLDENNIALEDIKTAEITFTVKKEYNGPVLFEGTAQFIVEIPEQ